MSDNVILHSRFVAKLTSTYVRAIELKYKHFPPRQDALEAFAKARKVMADNGVSESTLDDFEIYLKKVYLDVLEARSDKLEELTNRFVSEVREFYGAKAIESGTGVLEIVFD